MEDKPSQNHHEASKEADTFGPKAHESIPEQSEGTSESSGSEDEMKKLWAFVTSREKDLKKLSREKLQQKAESRDWSFKQMVCNFAKAMKQELELHVRLDIVQQEREYLVKEIMELEK